MDVTERPSPVHLEDLARPRVAPAVAELIALTDRVARPADLRAHRVCAAARSQTGLDDFGADESFVERLGVICRSIREEGRLSDVGVLGVFTQLVMYAVNRLRVEDLVKRHPEVLDLEVRAPIVIAGPPRTGTTHLHQLLAADPRLRFVPYWEAMEPVPRTEAMAVRGAEDPRIERADAAVALTDATLPHFKRMHQISTWSADEEIHLLAIDASSMIFEVLAHAPSWREYYTSHDQTPHYAYLKKVLQVLQYLRGGDRWLLKAPQHTEQFGPLISTFPDATVVVTHRDPVAATASLVTMFAYLARTHSETVDLQELGKYWATRMVDMLTACVRDRHLLERDRSIDIRFDDFMGNELGTLERVFRTAGQPLDSESREAIDCYRVEHPRGLHGGVVYSLAPFGLDPDELREAMAFYVDAFGLGWEDHDRLR